MLQNKSLKKLQKLEKSKIINEFNTKIQKWDNGMAVLWHYTASHSHLEIRLTKEDIEGNAHIVCEMCTKIKVNESWKSIKLRAKENTNSNSFIILTDINSDFYVYCDLIFLEKNVDPIY